jgi:hypothetical protein
LLRHHPQTVTRHLAVGCEQCRRAGGHPRWEHLVVTLPVPADEPTVPRAAELVPSVMGA